MLKEHLLNKMLERYPSSHWYFFWKGRVALYCFLKSLNLKKDDEVILPGLTCVVVPNAIIYAGLKPVYIDVDPNSFNMDPSLIEAKITPRTKVIILQNTFGLSTNVEEILAIAKKYSLITIDDCTHGFGGTYNGKSNGSMADVAFFSSQWNKPFSTVIGGYLEVNNSQFLEGVKLEYETYIQPSLIENIKILFLFYIKKILVNPKTYWMAIYCYRWLSKNDFILGSSQGAEITTIKKPTDYEKKLGWAQQYLGLKELKKMDKVLARRKMNAHMISKWLKENHKKYVSSEYYENHSWLKFPIRVVKRAEFFKRAEKANISLGDWFISPIHPVTTDFQQWGYSKGCCSVAEKAARELVNVPTDLINMKKLIRFLDEHKNYII
jgi:perosamine synthetase